MIYVFCSLVFVVLMGFQSPFSTKDIVTCRVSDTQYFELISKKKRVYSINPHVSKYSNPSMYKIYYRELGQEQRVGIGISESGSMRNGKNTLCDTFGKIGGTVYYWNRWHGDPIFIKHSYDDKFFNKSPAALSPSRQLAKFKGVDTRVSWKKSRVKFISDNHILVEQEAILKVCFDVSNRRGELCGAAKIRESVSKDGGNTWLDAKVTNSPKLFQLNAALDEVVLVGEPKYYNSITKKYDLTMEEIMHVKK